MPYPWKRGDWVWHKSLRIKARVKALVRRGHDNEAVLCDWFTLAGYETASFKPQEMATFMDSLRAGTFLADSPVL